MLYILSILSEDSKYLQPAMLDEHLASESLKYKIPFSLHLLYIFLNCVLLNQTEEVSTKDSQVPKL